LTYQAEQALIENRFCFQIIYDHHLNDLNRYRVLVLAGCVALSDEQIKQIEQYVKSGGQVCIVGQAATHDQWLRPREEPGLDNLPAARVVRIEKNDDIISAVRRACDDRPSLSVEAPSGLCAELTSQPGRRLVHLVNYRSNDPAKDISISLRLPARRRVESVTLVGPERESERELDFQEREGIVTFGVPQVGVYEIAVVTVK
ncbi:MAG: hypothetical protein ACYS74_21780, partial [Planctomycetota bacterium]